ncbi:MAG: hypothetical protein ABR586_06925 [Thermoplasmatota archaeon]
MARLRCLLLLAALLAAGLAGCASPPPAATQTEPAASVITDPRDTAYLRNATPGSHAHDYWQGRDTVSVVDASGGQMQASCSGNCDGMGIAFFRPEKDHVVPQGAAWVNVTVDIAQDPHGNSHGTPQLWVKTAKDSEPQRLGDLRSGVPFTLNSTNEMDDLPHSVLSLWRFEVHVPPPEGAGDVSFAGKVSLRAVSQRGLPLVVYGPHPDPWNGATEVALFVHDQAVKLEYQTETQDGSSTTCYGGCIGELPVDDGKTVPLDAAAVVVTLTFQPGAIPTSTTAATPGRPRPPPPRPAACRRRSPSACPWATACRTAPTPARRCGSSRSTSTTRRRRAPGRGASTSRPRPCGREGRATGFAPKPQIAQIPQRSLVCAICVMRAVIPR